MTRPEDDPIPQDEELYRALMPQWVEIDLRDIKASVVLPAGINSNLAISVNRQKYSAPKGALTQARVSAGFKHVAFITPATLPAPWHRVDLGNKINDTWEFFAKDCPEEGDAHAEIRWRKKGSESIERTNVSGAVRRELRKRLAAKFVVLL